MKKILNFIHLKIIFNDYEIRPLQETIIKDGKLVYKLPALKDIKAYAEKELATFWDEYKRLDSPHLFKVDLSDKLYELKRDMLIKIRKVGE